MKSCLRLFTPIFLLLFSSLPALGQEMHTHQHDAGEKLGKVNFPVSCTPAAQKQFNRAAALLHSFWYEESEKASAALSKTDPKCGMAHWEVAMSIFHPVWAPPNAGELQKGLAAIEMANSVGVKTSREKEYLAAIGTFYQDFAKRDHRTRALAYEQAMEQVYIHYPKDHEAGIFYALALLGTASAADKTYEKQKRAAEILNKILPAEPNHPGVAHYLIHSFDYPQLAQLALQAARRHAKIAPSSPHALHMPSHIFTRLGLWQESIASNLASAEAARKHVEMSHPGAAAFDQLHAIDYLVYAYLQRAEDQKAKQIVDQANGYRRVDSPVFSAGYAFSAAPARYALERRQWAEAARLELHPADFPWERFRYAEANVYFARSLGAARSGDPESAGKDVERVEAIQKLLADAKDVYWAGQVEIQRRAAAAWVARAEGKNDEALALMRSAVELEAATEKHPATPGPIIPARELLGDMLMELNQPEQAFKEYETSLMGSPNRLNGLYGAARSAELSGKKNEAAAYYVKLVRLTADADSNRAEVQKAKEFLARK